MPVKFSCKGCTERYVGCHSSCEKYIAEKAENDRIKDLSQKWQKGYSLSDDTQYSRNSKSK